MIRDWRRTGQSVRGRSNGSVQLRSAVTGDGYDPDRSNRCKATAGDAGSLAVRGDRDGRGILAAVIAFPAAPVGGVNGYLIGARVPVSLLIRGVGPAAQK